MREITFKDATGGTHTLKAMVVKHQFFIEATIPAMITIDNKMYINLQGYTLDHEAFKAFIAKSAGKLPLEIFKLVRYFEAHESGDLAKMFIQLS